jgi:hypothetical protein
MDPRCHVHHEHRAPALETLARVRAGLPALPVAGELEMLPPAPKPDPVTPVPEPDFSVTAWTKAMAADLDRWLDENVRSVPVDYPGREAA